MIGFLVCSAQSWVGDVRRKLWLGYFSIFGFTFGISGQNALRKNDDTEMERRIRRQKGRITAFAICALLSCAFALTGISSPAFAQQRIDIRFNPGATSTTVNGTIRGREYVDYVLNARGGQTMNVSLRVTGTNGNGNAYFNILPAGQDFGGLYTGSMDNDNRAEVRVPYTGNWAIRVYLMGNDRDTGKTVGYSIDVSVGSSGGSSASGGGVLPEEDFFVVRLSGGGSLNVRNAPCPSGLKLGELRNGTLLRNVGGCTMSGGQQWCNVQATTGGVVGWVAARFLALPAPGGGGSASVPRPPASGSDIVQVTGVASNDVLNVRSGPGTGNRVIGALGNGDRVRRLGCQKVGGATWCEIEMMTDMRERGWVNARFLTGGAGQATQLPSANRVERVRFAPGATGTEFTDQLGPGTTVTYLLSARNSQNLYFRLAANGPDLSWRLFNPDGSILDQATSDREYRGQLWQTGDHKIEVTNRSGRVQSFNVIFGVR
jgi:uncharacterized protein YraI